MNKSKILYEIIQRKASEKEIEWIQKNETNNLKSLQVLFVSTPRFIQNTVLDENIIINDVNIFGWSLIKLVRLYWLMHLDYSQRETYIQTLNTLFETAENNEAISLVSALPFLNFPEQLLLHATNAVRSNVGTIFDAIAFGNPYPKKYFSELAWNQLVLKCIFNDKSIQKIDGLTERTNKELAHSISNLANERWAAGRTIPSQSWQLVSDFLDAEILENIKKLFVSDNQNDQLAGALVCKHSPFNDAKKELEKNPKWKQKVETLSWNDI